MNTQKSFRIPNFNTFDGRHIKNDFFGLKNHDFFNDFFGFLLIMKISEVGGLFCFFNCHTYSGLISLILNIKNNNFFLLSPVLFSKLIDGFFFHILSEGFE